MLSRSQRLPTAQFDIVMKTGTVTHSPIFYLRSLKIGPTKDKSGIKARISAVVPVKVAKKAAQRNKIRRQIYEAVGLIYNSIIEDVNVIIFAKSGAKETTSMNIKKEVKDLFVKAGLLR